jgi:tRNA pseudouridine32 synthase/23S rRNA pseudouridine746 synthase
LPFLLEGFPVAPRRTWRPRPPSEEALVTVYEDERVVVVLKAEGLLSVPGRGEAMEDSVLFRLRNRYPDAKGPLLVHRLDLDTSGLLLAAKDEEAHAHLQAQFISRRVKKRYVAWLEGEVVGEGGTVALPLRVDVDQRPLQVVDFVDGREAVTQWRVLGREAKRTRVAFTPLTGRTHQLRVHAAHASGLGAPIVGDRLYGRPGGRLLLHAESLGFRHPDGRSLGFTIPAPF